MRMGGLTKAFRKCWRCQREKRRKTIIALRDFGEPYPYSALAVAAAVFWQAAHRSGEKLQVHRFLCGLIRFFCCGHQRETKPMNDTWRPGGLRWLRDLLLIDGDVGSESEKKAAERIPLSDYWKLTISASLFPIKRLCERVSSRRLVTNMLNPAPPSS